MVCLGASCQAVLEDTVFDGCSLVVLAGAQGSLCSCTESLRAWTCRAALWQEAHKGCLCRLEATSKPKTTKP